MSILGRKVPKKVVGAVVLAFVAVGGLLPVMSKAPAREITLVARNMAFYLGPDGTIANPSLEARAGETLRIVVVNRDRGMTHDFAVPVSGAATKRLTWNAQGDVTFDVPDKPGTYEYICRPHALMMKGRIVVK